MADRFYERARGKFAKGLIKIAAVGGDTIRVLLVDGTYTPNTTKTGHAFLSDIPAAARHGGHGSNVRSDAPQVSMADPSEDGVCTSTNPTVTFPIIPANTPPCPYLVMFKDDGVSDASSPLIVLLDSTPGLPFQANGADTILTWNSGPTGIFQL